MKRLNNRKGLLLFFAALMAGSVGCEAPEPTYRLKIAVGEDAVQHYDLMKDQPKYTKIRRREWDKKKAIEERRINRDKARGIYRKESLWDY